VGSFQRQTRCLKNTLLDMTFFVFLAHDEPDVLAFFPRGVTFKDEAFVFSLDKREAPGNAGKNCAHAVTQNPCNACKRWIVSCGKTSNGWLPLIL
jgi:hypothetical protein